MHKDVARRCTQVLYMGASCKTEYKPEIKAHARFCEGEPKSFFSTKVYYISEISIPVLVILVSL